MFSRKRVRKEMKLVIDIPDNEYKTILRSDETWAASCASKECMMYVIKTGTPLPTLTDPEQRLFLSAISREERLCKLIDRDTVPGSDVRMLVPLCQNIERKVKEVLF